MVAAKNVEQRESITPGAVVYLLLLAGCIALIRPFVNAGISDDFGYIRSANDFATTGHFIYHGAATPMLGWLIPFGALFIRLFGFSFTAARVATFSIAALNGLLIQWILLRLGCGRALALFGATAVLFSPVSLPVAMLFFTDGPGLFAMLVTFALCIRIVRAETPRATQLWIAAAFAASLFLGTVRQLLWLSTLVMVPSAIWLVRKRKGVLPWSVACFLLATTGVAALVHWWSHEPYSLTEPILVHYPLSQWTRFVIVPGMDLVVLMAPIFSLFLLRRVPAKTYIVSAVLALCAPLAIRNNPSNLLAQSSDSIFGGAPQWVFLLALAYACALLPIVLRVVTEAITRRQPSERPEDLNLYELSVLLAPFTCAVFLLVSSRELFWLRYLLEVVAAITLWLLKLRSDMPASERGRGSVAPVVVAVYCAFSIILTHDLYRTTAATLALTQQYAAQGLPRDQLEAGYSFDGWYQIERVGYENDRRIPVPSGLFVNHDIPRAMAVCHEFFLPETPSIHPVYGVGETLSPCFQGPVLASASYTAWIAPHHHTVFIARYAPQYALPEK